MSSYPAYHLQQPEYDQTQPQSQQQPPQRAEVSQKLSLNMKKIFPFLNHIFLYSLVWEAQI